MAEIKQLYSDAARTKPIYPKTVGSAVDLGDGKNLPDIMSEVGKLKYVILNLQADGWSDTAPYTQTVSIPGMTEDWVPGVPSFIPFFNSDGSVNTTDTVIGLEHAACVKILISSSGTLTAVCPEEKPTWNFSLRVPGMVERS